MSSNSVVGQVSPRYAFPDPMLLALFAPVLLAVAGAVILSGTPRRRARRPIRWARR